ncbi:MAG TPA: Bax inhibitor-1/YccA family protein [Gemmatimonadales bacterium]
MARPLFRSSNPALSPARFETATGDGVMTIAGTAWRALVLLALVVGSSAYTWWQLAADPAAAPTYVMGGLIGGLVLALVTIFVPKLSPWTAPIYAVVEGLALGALSMMFDAAYAGLPRMAVVLTLGVFGVMLALYAFRVVRVTERMRTVIVSAILGILVFYLASMVLGFFGIRIPAVHEGGPIGIAVSLFIVGVASFSLLLDFDRIENAASAGAPKFMEWYGAFGLIVTLIWLYIEMLNLLRKLRD